MVPRTRYLVRTVEKKETVLSPHVDTQLTDTVPGTSRTRYIPGI